MVFSDGRIAASVQVLAVGMHSAVLDKLTDRRDRLVKRVIGRIQDRNSLPVEYAGWVRIVGT